MAEKLENKQNVVPVGGTYPYGAIKDNPGNGSGTPFNTSLYGDIHQLVARMIAFWEGEGFKTANGLPDDANNGFQTYEALLTNARLANEALFAVFAQSFIGGNTVVDPMVPHILYGLVDDGSTITPGFVFYDGKLFVCAGISYPFTNVPVVNIVAENVMEIVDAVSGSGDFDYSVMIQSRKQEIGVLDVAISSKTYPGGTSDNVIKPWQTLPILDTLNDKNGPSYEFSNGYFKPKFSGWYEVSMSINVNYVPVLVDQLQLRFFKNSSNITTLFGPTYRPDGGNVVAYNMFGSNIVYLNGTTDYIYYTLTLSPNVPLFNTGTGFFKAKLLPNVK